MQFRCVLLISEYYKSFEIIQYIQFKKKNLKKPSEIFCVLIGHFLSGPLITDESIRKLSYRIILFYIVPICY